jgi:hypothetical protein
VILDVPKQIGRDFGLVWSATIEQDALRGIPLVNGQRYYFAVTAYSRNTVEGAPVASLESKHLVIEAIPQMPNPGVRYPMARNDTLLVNHRTGSGDATIYPVVIDPSETKDATYSISFNEDQSWKLSRNGEKVLDNQKDYLLDDSYYSVDGVWVKIGDLVFTPPTTYLKTKVVKDANPKDGNLAFWGDGLIFGNPDGYASTFWGEGGTQDETLLSKDLEFRFTGVWNSDSTEVVSGGSIATLAAISKGSGERSIDSHPFRPAAAPATGSFLQRIPFEVWDVDDPSKPRQLNVAFQDRGADGSREGNIYHKTYNMAGRDYITVIASDYDSTAIHELTDPNATWVLFFEGGGASVWSTGDILSVKYANRIIPGKDEFQFSTSAQTFSSEGAGEDAKQINVFPNPYYGVNEAETSRYTHFVTFSHLPKKATIRIFDLAGTLVRTIEKDSADQFEQWDLNNEEELPVASGLYIAHVEMPDVGKTKILKVAVIQEEQFLERY